jgi:iduronate 2-sulfatase
MIRPCLIVLAGLAWLGAAAGAEQPNVLLLLVDDLKPALGCYGDPAAKTPHLDGLAARGLRFDLAYCNQSVCAPSRFTLMLGSRSTSTGLYGLGSRLRDALPDAVTLPQHFARHGYRTESLGKVFHIGHGNEGDPDSFSVPHFRDKVIEYLDPASTGGGQLTREEALFSNQKLREIPTLPRGAAFESPDAGDADYADGRVAAETVRRLRAARERRDKDGTPFFIAAGFVRPHLPFSAPKRYWDLHDPDRLPLPANGAAPAGAPAEALKRGGEIAAYDPVPESAQPDPELARQLIHGYYASVSYVDAQIGKVIAALDELDLAKNTIVVLWGDHGFHLGDLGMWTKHTNYEQANRIPLLIVAPGVTRPGSSTRQLAESVDLFPTLAELAGLPAPAGPQPIDGVSLAPVLRDPAARVRDHAYHAFPKARLGRAIRTERHRLVEWKKPGAPADTATLEIYDYQDDPHETRNLAAERPAEVAALKAILATHPEAVPPAIGLNRAAPGKAKALPARP